MELTKTNFLSHKITYLFLIFIISRFFYLNFLNITFDNWTIDIYWQFFPKNLLENDLLNSIYFNHWQAPFLNFFVLFYPQFRKFHKRHMDILFYHFCSFLWQVPVRYRSNWWWDHFPYRFVTRIPTPPNTDNQRQINFFYAVHPS